MFGVEGLGFAYPQNACLDWADQSDLETPDLTDSEQSQNGSQVALCINYGLLGG